ncbi:MAG: hypothetical protein K6F53_01670 [Lachnospiraceae bacterium]|nr:hypothetical protein [Lachnospiraceae bacterium]
MIRTDKRKAAALPVLIIALLLMTVPAGCKKGEGSLLPEKKEATVDTAGDSADAGKDASGNETTDPGADAGNETTDAGKDTSGNETADPGEKASGNETADSGTDAGEDAVPSFKISPQGGYSVTFAGFDEDGKYLSDFSAYVDVKVSEEPDPDHPGYKIVSGVFKMDLTANPGPVYWNWVSAFDRETGISFECAADKNSYSADPALAYDGLGVLELSSEGKTADIRMKIDTDNLYPEVTDTVSVFCPEDYDGTVFQIGYISGEELDAYGKLNPAEETVTIGQLPNSGEEMLYFSAKDK